MIKKRQYAGLLSVEQAAEGIQLAATNAYTLYQDALLLSEHKRYPRCVSLCALAIEEAGKASILRAILMESDAKELKELWRQFRRHTAKNAQWIVPELILKGARKQEQLGNVFDNGSDHPAILDDLKQLGFYTDVFSPVKWSAPNSVIDAELAGSILAATSILAGKDKAGYDHVGELRLWVKYMKPVWKTSMPAMKNALAQIYAEAEAAGIVEAGSAANMAAFTAAI